MTQDTSQQPATLAPPKIRYKNGNEEKIVFPELDIFQRQQFVTLLCEGKTPELVMLCVNRNAAWMRNLDYSCYLELARYFINSNFHWALEIATHDPIMGLKVGPLMMQMATVLKLLPSRDSAHTRAIDLLSGSAPQTKPVPADAAAPTQPPVTGSPSLSSNASSPAANGTAPS
jgi:hypothetical protein